MILITGATGALGTAAINHLLTKVDPSQIAVLIRNESKAESFKQKGIAVRIGDYADIEALEQAMKGIEKVLLISSPNEHDIFSEHKNVIDAAKRNDVKQLVYTSLLVKDIEESPLRNLLQQHFDTEQYTMASGIAYTVLKNTMYTDAIPLFVGNDVLEKGIYLHAASGRTPFALRRELGEAAANVLLDAKHLNKQYELTASESYSYADVAQALTELSGKTVPFYAETTLADYEKSLKDVGFQEETIFAVAAFVTDKRNGVFEMLSDDLAFVLGRESMGLKESLKEVYGL